MSKAKKSANIPASVRQRLLNLSRQEGEDFNLVLTRFALERLLYRLGASRFGEQFVLKGAMLFSVWMGQPHRPTRDLDFLAHGNTSQKRLKQIFQQISREDIMEDGLFFDPDSIRVVEIREEQQYQGQRVIVTAYLEKARITLQIDIGFGDAITPGAKRMHYPTLLDFPAPRIRVYPRETVVAEKLQAMVALGIFNSRMKDFYDIWILSRQFSFHGVILAEAIRATFDRRKTPLPSDLPIALSNTFAEDSDKATQWKAFIRKNRLDARDITLAQVIGELRIFLWPVLVAVTEKGTFAQAWDNGGPWKLEE